MRVRVIEREIDPVWIPAVAALTSPVAADVDIVQGESLVAMPPDDFYVWIGRSLPALERDLIELASREPDRCSRNDRARLAARLRVRTAWVVAANVGPSARIASPRGRVRPRRLTDWREAMSSFAGPKDRMKALATNPVKAFQTRTYANWFATRGATLADFLFDYLRVIENEPSRCSREQRRPLMHHGPRCQRRLIACQRRSAGAGTSDHHGSSRRLSVVDQRRRSRCPWLVATQPPHRWPRGSTSGGSPPCYPPSHGRQ